MSLTLVMEEMVRYSCGKYTIECGPGDSWRWMFMPDDRKVKTSEDLEAMAAVSAAAATYLAAVKKRAAVGPVGGP